MIYKLISAKNLDPCEGCAFFNGTNVCTAPYMVRCGDGILVEDSDPREAICPGRLVL